MRYYLLIVGTMLLLNGCYKIGHEDFLDLKEERIGKKMHSKSPYKYKNSGKYVKDKSIKIGQGLTHITKNTQGNLIYHIDGEEVLPHKYATKEWIGKCKYYYVVDTQTFMIKSWGFEKDSNPLSCRTWP